MTKTIDSPEREEIHQSIKSLCDMIQRMAKNDESRVAEVVLALASLISSLDFNIWNCR